MPAHLLTAVLLGLGVTAILLGALGVVLLRGSYAALHGSSLATMTGGLSLGLAVVVEEGVRSAGLKASILVLLLLIVSPLATHAIGRAAWLREQHLGPDAGNGPGDEGC
ncbi:MAG: monovalent cation/H(+) antiporter subunit G [Bacteroidota bacterium]